MHETVQNIDNFKGVGAHLCKQICMQQGHVLDVDPLVNIKKHDCCPSFWLVKDELVSFCSCQEIRCIRWGSFLVLRILKWR